MKDNTVLIENVCNAILKRNEGEKPVSFTLKKERFSNICKEKNLTSNLKQIIINILYLNDYKINNYL